MQRATETAHADTGETPFALREWLVAVLLTAGVCAAGAFALGLAYWLVVRH